MQAYQINHKDFNSATLVNTPVVSKKSKPTVDKNQPNAEPKQIAYQDKQILNRYEHKSPDGVTHQVTGQLNVELPVLLARKGLETKPGKYNKIDAFIFTTFDLTDEETRSCVSMDSNNPGFIQKLYNSQIEALFKVKGAIPAMSRLSSKEVLEGVLGYPIHWKRAQDTGDIVPGRNPTKFFNLINFGSPGEPGFRRTPFKVPFKDEKGNYQTIPWEKLKGVSFKFKPTVQYSKVYIGSKASIQCRIISAIIYPPIVPVGDNNIQDKTLESMEEDKKLLDELKSQIDAIMDNSAKPASGESPKTPDEPNDPDPSGEVAEIKDEEKNEQPLNPNPVVPNFQPNPSVGNANELMAMMNQSMQPQLQPPPQQSRFQLG